MFDAGIRLLVADRRGLLADLATSIADAQGNIDNVSMERPDGAGLIAMFFSVQVRDRRHLAHIMRALKRVAGGAARPARTRPRRAPATRPPVRTAAAGSGRLLREQLLQLARLVHLAQDVAAADEFAVDVELRNRRPVGVFLDALADLADPAAR